ncbi:MAG: CaiB/BaiF CoA-transferase family protein [Hyphomicrobiales bacterium]|nr:CaiB/BaiF CoA-transferase family protein [Hyphomicrobiales bacterium]
MTPARPLSGFKVVELTRVLAAPWAGQILADLGADVIKIESPAGDDTRGWGPPFVQTNDGISLGAAYFSTCNRGKRSAVADFKTPEGQALVRRLATHADVLLENFKVGGLAAYGLDYASLRSINPRLVYCSVTGFGQTGPYAHRPGYDFLTQGMGGVMSVTGELGGQRLRSGVAVSDISAGLYAAIGVQAVLLQRTRTGEGAHVDIALLDSTVAILAYLGLNFLASGVEPGTQGNTHPNIVPYQPFKTADGEIIIAAGNNAQFAQLCAVLGRSDLARDPRYATNAERASNRESLVSDLTAHIALQTSADLLSQLEKSGVPAGPINDFGAVFADPQVIARGMQIDCDGVPGVRTPIMVDAAPATSCRAPLLAEHQCKIEAAEGWPDL